jgi:hypothetical protein
VGFPGIWFRVGCLLGETSFQAPLYIVLCGAYLLIFDFGEDTTNKNSRLRSMLSSQSH